MGFGDFVKRAVSAVTGIDLEQGGISGAIGSLAGVVSHAIPGVGPIIGTGVNAVQALFGQDSEETNYVERLRVTEKIYSKPEGAAVEDT